MSGSRPDPRSLERSIKKQTDRIVTRRKVLAGGSLALLSLAGCSGFLPGSNRQTETSTTSVNTATSGGTDSALRTFRTDLSDDGITVEAMRYTQTATRVDLSYTSSNPDSRETVTDEIGTITGYFFNNLDGDLDVEGLDATVLGPQGAEQILWHAERKWYQELQDGEITPRELTLRVVQTAEEVN